MTKLEIAAIYSAINILILVVLIVRVVQARRANRVVLGDGGVPALLRAIRAHGNAAETMPVAIGALLFLVYLDSVPAWAVHLLGGAFTLGRFAHAYGVSTYAGIGPGPGRMIGVVLTVFSLAGFAAAMFWGAFVHG
ncbi:MAG TPA: MAPEG family protein [Caulobacterales bacterium]|nr:MAPEG family protein [Caulobacterales bacterium]